MSSCDFNREILHSFHSLLVFVLPSRQAVWLMKCRCLTSQSYIDEVELEEEGVGELLMDDNAIADMPRYARAYEETRSLVNRRLPS